METTTNYKAQGLAVAVVNEGATYATRKHLAAMSFSRPVPEYKALVKAHASHERAQFGTKYSAADVAAATIEVLGHDRQAMREMMRDKVQEGAQVTARGRKWFDKANGNTYHSVFMTVGGVSVYVPMQYGYDDQWKQTAIEWLVENGIFEDKRHANGDRAWRQLYDLVQWGDAPYGLKRDL